MMLQEIRDENVASLVERTIRQGLDEGAEFIHFELKQHFFLIRLRWMRESARTTLLLSELRWRGSEVLEYLKATSGMNSSISRVPQDGLFAFMDRGQVLELRARCRPYMTEERVILSLHKDVP